MSRTARQIVGEADEISPAMKEIALDTIRGIAGKRNPLTTAWTGTKAFYTSPSGNYGMVPHSELAMHVKQAGKPIVRYALFQRATARDYVIHWAHIQTEDGKVLDGTPGEVLSQEIRNKVREEYGAEHFIY